MRTVFFIGWMIFFCASVVSVNAGETPTAPPAADENEAAENDTLTAPTEGEDTQEAMLQFVNQPWKGDLDGMLKRGLIRALVVNSTRSSSPGWHRRS